MNLQISDTELFDSSKYCQFFDAIFSEAEKALLRGEGVRIQTDGGDIIASITSLEQLQKLKLLYSANTQKA